jgi:two-component system, NarL family, response regulator NreC
MIRVFITEDHVVVRSGLRLLIDNEDDLCVIGETDRGLDAVTQVAALTPDVVLMDISLPDISGIEVVRQLKQNPDLKVRVLMLTMHAEADYLRLALDAGADGYVVKSVADDELLDAIRVVYRGRSYLRPEAVSVLIDDSPGQAPEAVLSDREIEILKLVAHGHTNAEIGSLLYLSPKTVDTYRRRVMQKLTLETRADMVDYALKHDLLKPTRSAAHDSGT